jgi:putative ATPase
MAQRRPPPQGDDLFAGLVDEQLTRGGPLASRMRPQTLEDVVGQPALLGANGFLRRAIADDRAPSMVLYGPPGSGKTTLARVVAASSKAVFEELSATQATLAEVRAALSRARDRLATGQRTVLFIDEIHRFNKGQQDALLPAVEEGLVTLIGATTENPYYEVNAALVSRMRVMVLEALGGEEIGTLVDRALADERGLAGRVGLDDDARAALISRAGGDARAALNLLEAAAGGLADGASIDAQTVLQAGGGRAVVYDKSGDAHYDTISAFIKSMRGSDPDAAVYYLAVMLAGGEDPKFIARRIIVAASEDVGNADPRALSVAVAAGRAVEFIGLPEARINLAHAAT